MGILSLLVVILLVLGGAVAFFLHVARRAAMLAEQESRAELPSSMQGGDLAR